MMRKHGLMRNANSGTFRLFVEPVAGGRWRSVSKAGGKSGELVQYVGTVER
jgi:hypothetical protein